MVCNFDNFIIIYKIEKVKLKKNFPILKLEMPSLIFLRYQMRWYKIRRVYHQAIQMHLKNNISFLLNSDSCLKMLMEKISKKAMGYKRKIKK